MYECMQMLTVVLAVREDSFLKEHAGVVAVAAGQAVQVELDRFSLATSLLAVASRAHWGLPCALAAPSPPDVMGATPPDSIKAKFEKQVCLHLNHATHTSRHTLLNTLLAIAGSAVTYLCLAYSFK